MNTAAMTVGAPDFAFGTEYLEKVKREYNFLTSANIYKNGKIFFKPYILTTVKGVKVGIFGLTEPQKANKNMKVEIKDPVIVTKNVVMELKKYNPAVIILLSQLQDETLKKVLRQNKDISLVINGMDTSEAQVKTIDGRMVFSVRAQGKYLGKIQISQLNKESTERKKKEGLLPKLRGNLNEKAVLNVAKTEFITVFDAIPNEPKIGKLLKEYQQGLAKEKFKPLPSAKKEKRGAFYVGGGVCRRCHVKQFDFVMTTSHSKAYKTLESAGNHVKPTCVSCHTTGFGKVEGFTQLPVPNELKGVQCEVCHGPGSLHFKKGNIVRKPSETLCFECHTKEQSLDFNPKKVWDKIKCPK